MHTQVIILVDTSQSIYLVDFELEKVERESVCVKNFDPSNPACLAHQVFAANLATLLAETYAPNHHSHYTM